MLILAVLLLYNSVLYNVSELLGFHNSGLIMQTCNHFQVLVTFMNVLWMWLKICRWYYSNLCSKTTVVLMVIFSKSILGQRSTSYRPWAKSSIACFEIASKPRKVFNVCKCFLKKGKNNTTETVSGLQSLKYLVILPFTVKVW